MPQVDFPTISVTTQSPRRQPRDGERVITGPAGAATRPDPGLSVLTSTSSFGLSQITLQFISIAILMAPAQDVQAAIHSAGSTCPDAALPATYARSTPPIRRHDVALTSRTTPLRDLSDLADTLIAQRVSEVPGVGSVSIQGNLSGVRVQAIWSRLRHMGESEDLRSAVAAANVSSPKGSLDNKTQSLAIAANDQITSARTMR